MVVRRYKSGDVYKAEWNEPTTPQMDGLFMGNRAFTFLLEDEVVAIMGFSELWDQVGMVAMLVSDKVRGHGLELAKEVRSALKIAVAFYNSRKVYALVDDRYEDFKRWIDLFGFVPEYVMKEAGSDGQDIIGYSQEYERPLDVEGHKED